jgi:hypothetical protein
VLHSGDSVRGHTVKFFLSRGLVSEGLDKEVRVLPVLDENVSEAQEEESRGGLSSGGSSNER